MDRNIRLVNQAFRQEGTSTAHKITQTSVNLRHIPDFSFVWKIVDSLCPFTGEEFKVFIGVEQKWGILVNFESVEPTRSSQFKLLVAEKTKQHHLDDGWIDEQSRRKLVFKN